MGIRWNAKPTTLAFVLLSAEAAQATSGRSMRAVVGGVRNSAGLRGDLLVEKGEYEVVWR